MDLFKSLRISTSSSSEVNNEHAAEKDADSSTVVDPTVVSNSPERFSTFIPDTSQLKTAASNGWKS